MGQYYKAISIDHKECVNPHALFNGAKLMEHSYLGNAVTDTVMVLLADQWHGTHIVWAGDYADNEVGQRRNLYSLTHMPCRAATPLHVPRYLLNLDTQCYVDTAALKADAHGFTLHPLPLLTCEGNGRGGGDFHGDDSRIGRWARHRLAASDIAPSNFTEFDGAFAEH
jgi:hypothetical protein